MHPALTIRFVDHSPGVALLCDIRQQPRANRNSELSIHAGSLSVSVGVIALLIAQSQDA